MMKKIVLRIHSKQSKQLTKLAKQQKVSVAEISRRAIDQFIKMSDVDYAQLDILINAWGKSSDKAIKALEEAEAAVTNTINQIRQSSPKVF